MPPSFPPLRSSHPAKTFPFPHADGKRPLWLMHKWGTGCDTRSLVSFEGEGDAASYCQLTGGKYPVVSVPTGAKGSLDVLKNHYEWLDRFDKLVLLFDGDETGREWSRKAAAEDVTGLKQYTEAADAQQCAW